MRRLLRRLMASRVAAAAVCVVLAVLVGGGISLLLDEDDLPSAPHASVDVAHDFAIAATTFDYRRIEADRDRVLAFGTDELRREFAAAMGDAFAERAAEARRVSVGEIVAGPTVTAVTDERAEFVVILNQQFVSEGEQQVPQIVRVAMVVTVETDDEPLVTRVQVF